MEHPEFETEQVVNQFKDFFQHVWPEGTNQRQKADLIATFMAGYCSGAQDFKKAINKFSSIDGAILFMNEIINDTTTRAKYAAQCMLENDFSHEMFE